MRKGIITSILLLTLTGVQAQNAPASPKLVVTLTIDQLRSDYLEAFSSLYGEHGFKRLKRDGRVYLNATAPFINPDRASAVATIFTGASPSLHSIIGAEWLDVSTLRRKNCVDDVNYMGNYTEETSSPAQMLTSTICDELRIETDSKGMVYAISPFRDAAILSAGHAATGAFWINEYSGKWCSTTYYTEFPWWVNKYNESKSLDFRIKDLTWTPMHPITSYKYLPEWRDIPFKYTFNGDKLNKFRHVITSPLVNDEVNMLTEELLNNTTIGQDDVTDILALTYYGGNYQQKTVRECAMEMQDAYARMDKSIANLLSILDKKIGLHNILFCLTSTGYSDADGTEPGTYRIPSGEFYIDRCTTLLNVYLMATYGDGKYIEGYDGLQIYLNHKLIEDKRLDMSDIQEKASQFLIKFSGVNEVYSANRILLGSWTPRMERIRNGYHRKRSGDILIEILPGWTLVQDGHKIREAERLAETPSPIIFMGAGIKPEIIQTPVYTDRITPTLSKAIHIRAPNACTAIPFDF